jgi:Putative metallopeptidase
VAGHAADEFAWPAPFTLEMQSCGFPNARWDLATHKLTLCYELAGEFADLYRNHGGAGADGVRTAESSKRKSVGAAAFKPNRQTTHRKRKVSQ